MEDLVLNVTERDILGKKTRFLRRQGATPVHLFGHNLKSLTLQSDTEQLRQIIGRAGTTKIISLKVASEKNPRNVFIREIQRHAGTGDLIHVDFYQIRKTEKIKAEVPIILIGESPVMKLKGRILMHSLDSLSVECLPDKLPHQIEVDLSQLQEIDQSVHVKDIAAGPGVTVITDSGQLVVKISEAAARRAEAAEAEEAEAEAEAKAEAGAEVPAETEAKPEE
ncbi:50S ribosomal protein L25 [Chloroflexota bacterium]